MIRYYWYVFKDKNLWIMNNYWGSIEKEILKLTSIYGIKSVLLFCFIGGNIAQKIRSLLNIFKYSYSRAFLVSASTICFLIKPFFFLQLYKHSKFITTVKYVSSCRPKLQKKEKKEREIFEIPLYRRHGMFTDNSNMSCCVGHL